MTVDDGVDKGAVLIVEDDEATAELERRALSRSGIRVRTVSRVDEAIALLRRESFAAVLLDYQLPDGDPWRVLEEAQARVPRIPVVIVTGMGNERVAAEAIHRGAAEYVKKTDSFWDQLPGIVDRVARLALAEEQVRRSDALFHLIAENTSDWISIVDLRGVYTYVSPACHDMFGEEPGELVGRRGVDFVHPEDRAGVEYATADALCSPKGPFRVTYRHRRKDGGYRWVEAHATVLYDSSGESPTEVLEVVRDITERMKAEDAIRKEQEQLADAQRIAHVGSWEWDITTDEVLWSNELYRIFGVAVEPFGGSYAKYLERVHPDDRDRVNDVIQNARHDNQPFTFDHRIVRPNGDHRCVHAIGHVWVGDSGSPVRMSGTAQDITERKELEEQLEARTRQIESSLREKEVLLKEIHHRVKNNLAVIQSLLYLQLPHTHDAQTVRIFEESQHRVRSMALVHETLYRSDDLSDIDFGDYARALATELLATYSATNGRVRLETDVETVRMSIDLAVPGGLILNEIISNVLKHAFPDGEGRITLTVRAPAGGRTCLIEVADDGIGLPADLDVETRDSFGLRLIRLLTKQINASVELIRTEPGTRARLAFALDADADAL